MNQGYLSIVLHAHLPFVRHPEHERFLEENWLFEAIVARDAVEGPHSYSLRATSGAGSRADLMDTYAFGPLLSDFDLGGDGHRILTVFRSAAAA